MGNSQSVRATHFQRPDPPEDELAEEIPDDHHISISNKMVERLVEDATLAGGTTTPTATPRGDYKDKIHMERIKCLDDSHSARTGLTIDEMNTLASRIDFRTSNMVSVEPVCAECKDKVIDCYNSYGLPEDNIKCWDIVGEFSACVQAAGAARLQARSARAAREQARLTRHVARARRHELRDLAPEPREPASV